VKTMKKEGPLLAGEVERAATWAKMLFNKVEAFRPAMQRSRKNRDWSLFVSDMTGILASRSYPFPLFTQRPFHPRVVCTWRP